MKSVHWSVNLGVRIYLFQLHLFEMNQGVHIPFAWCVFRFIGVTYVLSSTSPSFSLKKVLKLFSISLTFIGSVTGFIENEFRGRENLTQPEKKRLTAHTKVELFFRLLVYLTTRHWEHSHENEQYHRSEWHTVTKFKKNIEEQTTSNGSGSKCTNMQHREIACVCVWHSGWKSKNFVIRFVLSEKIFSLVLVCANSDSLRHSMSSC